MEGSGNRELHGLAGSVFLGHPDGESDVRLLPGDDDLARAVEISDIHVCGGGEVTDQLLLSPDDGGHPALGCLTSLLHEAGALVNQSKSRLEIKGARSRMGREFTEREAGCRLEAQGGEFLLQDGKHSQSMGVECGLANRGLGQFLSRPLESNLGERIAEDRVGLGKEFRGDGKIGGEILAHADGLGTLSGEEKCGFHA